MSQQLTHDEIIRAVKSYVESEAEKLFQSVMESAKCVDDLHSAMWDLGRPKKEGTDIEKMLHQLIYNGFAKKAREIIRESTQMPLSI
ncbi:MULTISPECIES: hypothetical protein [unclassified Paenibacillus]|uniref:hypothetical protein n=1 Tax=unclassified Paenibacillus TaxID=185978 RepID=UPI0009A619C6|nr:MULTISPECIES: hypothetical protein [unclassified Paenibacillus]SLJ98379.1 hypothetical protein SAMN06272722_102744 [Paenibacillus sp. RU5A]SOC66771.1 hypothetical protein SAMN05880581_102253 [Paenibacillus sp. RU26A]SOC70080.1 hypothetical protein SAMN05880586_102744 [Paenibacillus sp. RU5M]